MYHNPEEASPPLSTTGRHFLAPSQSHGVCAVAARGWCAATRDYREGDAEQRHDAHIGDPITGDVSRFPHATWARRCDLVEEDGRWSSPSHLRILANRVAGRDGASHA